MTKLDYSICKALKEAGMPQEGNGGFYLNEDTIIDRNYADRLEEEGMGFEKGLVYIPTLEELMCRIGKGFNTLKVEYDYYDEAVGWVAGYTNTIGGGDLAWTGSHKGRGKTPIEAVANLVLAIHENNNPQGETHVNE